MSKLRGKYVVHMISDDVHILAPQDDDAIKMQRKYHPQCSHLRMKFPAFLPLRTTLYLDEDFLIPHTYTYLKPPETVP